MKSGQREVMLLVTVQVASKNLKCSAQILQRFVWFPVNLLDESETTIVRRNKTSAKRVGWILLPEGSRQWKTLLEMVSGLLKGS
jgi:hypothetical protein